MKNGQSGAGMMDCDFSNVRALVLAQFRKDFPALAARLEAMREACGGGGSAAGAAAGVPAFMTPPSNTGVNKIMPVVRGLK